MLPLDYAPGNNEALPCIVQPHGREATPLGPASRWRDLPTTERFMVICPDSAGRRDPYNSWAVAGQLQDIAEIVGVVESSIPWVHVDHQRLYLVGISMGGQETLCTIARYPDLFAAGLCVDGNANLAARYRELPRVDMADTQPLMRREVGGTPAKVPWLYQRRSSIPVRRDAGHVRRAHRHLVEPGRHDRLQPGRDADRLPLHPDQEPEAGRARRAGHRDGRARHHAVRPP